MFFKKSDSYPNLWKSKNTVNIYFSLVQFKNHFLLIPHINKCCIFPLGFGAAHSRPWLKYHTLQLIPVTLQSIRLKWPGLQATQYKRHSSPSLYSCLFIWDSQTTVDKGMDQEPSIYIDRVPYILFKRGPRKIHSSRTNHKIFKRALRGHFELFKKLK